MSAYFSELSSLSSSLSAISLCLQRRYRSQSSLRIAKCVFLLRQIIHGVEVELVLQIPKRVHEKRMNSMLLISASKGRAAPQDMIDHKKDVTNHRLALLDVLIEGLHDRFKMDLPVLDIFLNHGVVG